MASPTGHYAEPTLDGEHLLGATTEIFRRSRQTSKAIREMADGTRRQFAGYPGVGLPMLRRRRTWTAGYASLRDVYDQVEELLADPGPHTWCDWKMEHLAYVCDGTRTAFELPWVPALHTLSPPRNLSSLHLGAVVVHGRGSGKTEYTVANVSQASYDAGSPPAATVWFRTGDTAFKVLSAPGATKRLYVRVVPLYNVVEAETTDQEYRDNAREPRSLVLMEVGS